VREKRERHREERKKILEKLERAPSHPLIFFARARSLFCFLKKEAEKRMLRPFLARALLDFSPFLR
jgi:hypothetical protein